jgi:coenzyme F420-reducing hydrogenase gamma subunit
MATPIADHVVVDAELRGCPIDPGQLLELLTAVVVGRRPQLPDESVCAECKRRGATCVIVAKGIACLGPVTRTGCGALCPVFGRGCYGCFGPRGDANVISLVRAADGFEASDISSRFAGFTAWAEPFRSVIDAHGGPPGAEPDASVGPAAAAPDGQAEGVR